MISSRQRATFETLLRYWFFFYSPFFSYSQIPFQGSFSLSSSLLLSSSSSLCLTRFYVCIWIMIISSLFFSFSRLRWRRRRRCRRRRRGKREIWRVGGGSGRGREKRYWNMEMQLLEAWQLLILDLVLAPSSSFHFKCASSPFFYVFVCSLSSSSSSSSVLLLHNFRELPLWNVEPVCHDQQLIHFLSLFFSLQLLGPRLLVFSICLIIDGMAHAALTPVYRDEWALLRHAVSIQKERERETEKTNGK